MIPAQTGVDRQVAVDDRVAEVCVIGLQTETCAAGPNGAHLGASRIESDRAALRRRAQDNALALRPGRDGGDRSVAIAESELQLVIERRGLEIRRSIETVVLLRTVRDVLVVRGVIHRSRIAPAVDA